MVRHRGNIRYAPIQTLPTENVQFEFCHVQPAAMLGRVVAFEALRKSQRFSGVECLIECWSHVTLTAEAHHQAMTAARLR